MKHKRTPKERKVSRDVERFRMAQLRANIGRLKAQGLNNTEIARILGVDQATIRTYTKVLLDNILQEGGIAGLTEDELIERFPRPSAENDQIRVAYEMRCTGMSYFTIGVFLGVADTTVERWLVKEVTRLEADALTGIDKARRIELDRLDRLQQAHWFHAERGDVDATKIIISIMKRRSDLLGLDAPQRINIENDIRELARANGLDEDEALAEAAAIISENKR